MNIAELFVGAGGLAIGAHKAGLNCKWAVDFNSAACSTLRLNKEKGFPPFSGMEILEQDIRNLSYNNEKSEIDILIGGPPCQPFSLGGLNKFNKDGRDMFPEAIRSVRKLQPRAFLFENVKGLARSSMRNYLQYICLQLKHPEITIRPDEEWLEHLARLEDHEISNTGNGLTYNVLSRVINSADYGVPQKRERIFIIGFRSDVKTEWHFPESTHSEETLLWEKWKSGIYWENHRIAISDREIFPVELSKASRLLNRPSKQAWATVRDAISDLLILNDKSTTVTHHNFVSGAKIYRGHTGSQLDYPSKTLKAGVHGVPGGENMIRFSDGSVRYFTIRECARIQTFPDEMLFYGSWSDLVKQLGNAVPCLLAEKILHSMKKALLLQNSPPPNSIRNSA